MKVGDVVRFSREESVDGEAMPIVVHREDGPEVGEVPVKIARTILGCSMEGLVVGFKPLAVGLAPLVEVRILEPTPSNIEPVVLRPASGYPTYPNYQQHWRSPSAGPNATQLLVLFAIVAVGLLLGMSGIFASGKSVHVHGYTRSDGTSVSDYERFAPGTKDGSVVLFNS